jgi:hypothetical protein
MDPEHIVLALKILHPPALPLVISAPTLTSDPWCQLPTRNKSPISLCVYSKHPEEKVIFSDSPTNKLPWQLFVSMPLNMSHELLVRS